MCVCSSFPLVSFDGRVRWYFSVVLVDACQGEVSVAFNGHFVWLDLFVRPPFVVYPACSDQEYISPLFVSNFHVFGPRRACYQRLNGSPIVCLGNGCVVFPVHCNRYVLGAFLVSGIERGGDNAASFRCVHRVFRDGACINPAAVKLGVGRFAGSV